MFGIINVTPDSFSDGGEYISPELAANRASALLLAGADVVDVGAESTRPGATPIDTREEWGRLEPVLRALQELKLIHKVSVDTRNFLIMKNAAEFGCAWINCVGPLPNEGELQELVRINPKIGYVATHMHGIPESMNLQPMGPNKVIARVEEFFESSRAELTDSGFSDSQQLFDPGVGFGKSDSANLVVLAHCALWARHFQLALGVSRKSIFSRLFGIKAPRDRDAVSKVSELALALSGVRMIRTHDVPGLMHCFQALDWMPS